MKLKKFLKVYFLLIILIVFGFWGYMAREDKIKSSKNKPKIPFMDVIINNDSDKWTVQPLGSPNPYPVPFVKIKTLSFGSDADSLFVRFDLGGRLPTTIEPMPKYENDPISSSTFYLDLFSNYFDKSGRINPGGADAKLKFSFYGTKNEADDSTKINIDGTLVAGGPGDDYFVVKFPYQEILFNQTGPTVVVRARSVVNSEKYQLGASGNTLLNSSKAATPDDPRSIKIILEPKQK